MAQSSEPATAEVSGAEADPAAPLVNPTPHVTEVATSSAGQLAGILRAALQDAMLEQGQMDPAVFKVQGYCGRRFRLLLNNIIRTLGNDARYLEVGVFRGATLAASLAGNRGQVIGIDNWSWDKAGASSSAAKDVVTRFTLPPATARLIDQDFLTIDPTTLGRFNVYFYDGDHSEAAQYKAIEWALPALTDPAIILVDDWNFGRVRSGTLRAIRDLKLRVDYMVELRTSWNGKVPKPAMGRSDWHNGFFGAVVSRG